MTNLVAFHWWDRTSVSFHTAITDNPTEFGRLLRKDPEIVCIESVVIQDLIDEHFQKDHLEDRT